MNHLTLPPQVPGRVTVRLRLAAVGALAAGIAAMTAAIIVATQPAPPAPVAPPPVKDFDLRQFSKDSQYMQQGMDLHSLGKAGLAHDRWILQHYGPPAPPPKPKPAKVPPRPSWDWRQT